MNGRDNPFSAGPWTADTALGFINDAKGEHVCQFWDKFEEDFPNKEHNMRLVAEAPAMFAHLHEGGAALQMVLEMLQAHRAHPSIIASTQAKLEATKNTMARILGVTREEFDAQLAASEALAKASFRRPGDPR